VSRGAGRANSSGVNHSLFTGDITYYPLDDPLKKGHWMISGRVVANNEYVAEPLRAVIDSGTTMIMGPTKDLEAFYAALPTETFNIGKGLYVYRATPGLGAGFSFGDDVVWAIDDEDLCWNKVDASIVAEVQGAEAADSVWCIGGVVSAERVAEMGNVDTGMADAEIHEWIIGAAFMKNHYTAFRASPPAVGFAELTPEANGRTSVDGMSKAQVAHSVFAKKDRDSGALARLPSLALLGLALAVAL
jgi:cathepsin D